jgi:8-oxo-dGTP pyrophosphatase MutT (NUDIX family)
MIENKRVDFLIQALKNIGKDSRESYSTDNSCAAVLLPIVIGDGKCDLLFTKRTANVASHQNEVSFPGGSYEKDDVSMEATALRETYEEIGLEGNQIQIIGHLPVSNTVTGFSVFPFVGLVKFPYNLKINRHEVEKVFTIPIDWLENPDNFYEADYHSEKFGVRKVIHYKDYEGEHLWGYTARLTQQLLELLNKKDNG